MAVRLIVMQPVKPAHQCKHLRVAETLTLASTLVLLAACAQTSAAPELIGTAWQLDAYSDGRGSMKAVIAATQPNAVFESTGFVTGSGGCNAYSTVFESAENALTITGPIVATHALCDQAVMDQEAAYFSALARAATYRVENGQLVLVQSGGATLAEYHR